LAAWQTAGAFVVSVLMLVGVVCYSMQFIADQRPLTSLPHSPEDQRERGGGVGASMFNRPDVVNLRTKFNQGQ
jgi:hypothetical protein